MEIRKASGDITIKMNDMGKTKEMFAEDRMNIIGQNGNDGLHYEGEEGMVWPCVGHHYETLREENKRCGTPDLEVESHKDILEDYLYVSVEEFKEKEERKATPVATGVLNYFPDALKEVAKTSLAGNNQHHPGKPLHWDKEKSNDHEDAMVRHLLDHYTHIYDNDGQLHLAKVAWRALAALQTFLENKKTKK